MKKSLYATLRCLAELRRFLGGAAVLLPLHFTHADTLADFAELTAGLTNFPIQCCPGSVVVYGRTAFPVLVEPTGNQVVLEAAGYHGDDTNQARGVAFAHDQWGTFSDARIDVVENAVRWASRKSNPAQITVGIGPGLNAAHFSAQGYTVKNVTVAMDSPSTDLSGCDVFVAHWHYGYTAAAVTKIVEFAEAGGGVVMLATPWALQPQQAADAVQVLSPFGISWSDRIPQDYGFTNVQATAYSENFSAIPAAENLLKDLQGIASLSLPEKTIAARAIEQVLAVRSDLTELNNLVAQISASAGWIAPTRQAPLVKASQPVEAMLARFQSRQFDAMDADGLFVHPAAADWPGLPVSDDTVDRSVVIDGDTHASDFYMNQGNKPTRRETGLYVMPGVNVTITIPPALIDAGWQVHIGGTEDDAFNLDTWRNFPRVWRRVALTHETTFIGHVFGGLITVLVPVNSSAGLVSLTISNAVEAPVFNLATDTDEMWNSTLKWKPAPWGYLQTSNLVIYLPRWQLTNVNNMSVIARHWADVMATADAYYGYTAYRKRPEVVSCNRQVSAGAAYAGYPIELGWGADSETELQSSVQFGSWGVYHELGHGFQNDFDGAFVIPTGPYGGEVDVNLLPGLIYLKLHDQTSWDYNGDYYGAAARTAKRANFMALPAEEQTWERACSIYDPAGSAYDFYYTLADAFGWEVYRTALGRLMDWLQGGSDSELAALDPADPNYKRNRFYLLFCDASQRNLDLFFQRYGLGVPGRGYEISSSVKAQVAAKGYPSWLDNQPLTSLSDPGLIEVSEATPPGTELYTFTATDPEPGTVFSYEIVEGNDGSFTLDRRSGTLRVGGRGLDYELVPQYTLQVAVSDNGVPRYYLTNTATLQLTNVPEAPRIDPLWLRVNDATAPDAAIGQLTGRFEAGRPAQFWFILSGNDDNLFALDFQSGLLRRTATGTLPNPGIIQLVVGVKDASGRAGYGTVHVVANAESGLLEERWDGQNVFAGPPVYTGLLPEFETPVDVGENYSRRVSGYLIPPATDDYTFWIASDDDGALFLGSEAYPASKIQIAAVNGWTAPREFDKMSSQQSAPIRLEGGRAYYIEAHQVEMGVGDHLSVAWASHSFGQTIIPGQNLIPQTPGLVFPASTRPTITTLPATGLDFGLATLTAEGTRGGADAWVIFEWGTTTDYDHATPLRKLNNDTEDFHVGYFIADLLPGITYHYRAVIVNPAGTAFGDDLAFTALPPPNPVISDARQMGAGLLMSGYWLPGGNAVLESSLDLENWAWRARITPDVMGGWEFLEPDMASAPRRFYRLKAFSQFPTGLFGWYQAEGNYLDSFGPHHGVPVGEPGFSEGIRGQAVSFDGVNSGVAINAEDVPQAWTLSVWINRLDSLDPSAALLSSETGAIKVEQWGTPRLLGFTQYGVADYAFNVSLPPDTWTHLAMVATPAGTKLYINGALMESHPASIACPLGVLGHRRSDSDRFRGQVDELMIFTRELAPDVIQYLRNTTGPLSPP